MGKVVTKNIYQSFFQASSTAGLQLKMTIPTIISQRRGSRVAEQTCEHQKAVKERKINTTLTLSILPRI